MLLGGLMCMPVIVLVGLELYDLETARRGFSQVQTRPDTIRVALIIVCVIGMRMSGVLNFCKASALEQTLASMSSTSSLASDRSCGIYCSFVLHNRNQHYILESSP